MYNKIYTCEYDELPFFLPLPSFLPFSSEFDDFVSEPIVSSLSSHLVNRGEGIYGGSVFGSKMIFQVAIEVVKREGTKLDNYYRMKIIFEKSNFKISYSPQDA